MPDEDAPPGDAVESALEPTPRASSEERLAVLAARHGRSAAEIADFLDRPIAEVQSWIEGPEVDGDPIETRLDDVEAVIRTIVGTETPEGVLGAVTDLTAELFETEKAALYRYDGVREELVSVVQTEESFGLDPITPEHESLWAVFESGESASVTSGEIVVPAGTFGLVRIDGVDPDEVADVDLRTFRPVASAAVGSVVRLRRIESLRTDREELREENEQLREFANIVSHDLRNPLSVAVGAFEMVVETGEEEYVEQVKEAHERIEGIIEHTLSLAREGRRVDEAESVDLESLARRAWGAVDTGEASLTVEATTSIEADPDRLRQAFENLFRNAVEHGGDDVTVRVGTLDGGFYVEDDGPGIPEAERERVFEREYTNAEEGSGLGLHIVREIVEGHDWTITVTDGTDGGARFEIEGV